jgi:uncharacterized damage-inducible protein DinB
MNTALVELFRHNQWANVRLLDACTGLSEDVLRANVVGTYGEIWDTLEHFVRSEEGYLYRLETGQPSPDGREQATPFDVAALRERSRQSGERFIAVAERFKTGERYGVSWEDGNTYSIPAEIYLAQAITHATEHRSQVATILTQQGIEPPDVSVWAWCDDVIIPESQA